MTTGRLLSDEIISPEITAKNGHPRDSSQLLLGLMTLARQAEEGEEADAESSPMAGIISRGVLRILLCALGYRDPASVVHARRVAMLSVGTADYLGWDTPQQKLLEVAALLHDIGKIGVPDHILFKPDKLSAEEAELMDLHRHIGMDVLQACRVDHEVLDIISQAHGHFGGAGSGFGPMGADMHQGARILAVADAYDALSTDREYRRRKPHDEVVRILMQSSGSQFDGNVVGMLSRWIEKEGLPFSEEKDAPGQPPAGAAPSMPGTEGQDASLLCHIFSYLYFLESLYDGFYLVDSDLRFVVWNAGVEQLLGRSARQLLGQTWTSRTLSHADASGRPLAERDCPMYKVIDTGKPNTCAARIQHTEGHWVEVELQSVPLFDTAGRLHGVAQIFQDTSRSSRVPEYRELKLQASRDALTGVANRGELERQLELTAAEYSSRKDAEPFSVIFLDIDFFKSINDTFGHAAGDRVLVDMSRLLQHETYSGELISRYGGEEFVILCPGTDLEHARMRAERLRKAILDAGVGELTDFRVTSSFGVAEMEPGDSARSLLKRADRALYMSKESGRNRTTVLTNEMLHAKATAGRQQQRKASGPMVLSESFDACVTSDMIVYKLGGFVDDHGARLKDVQPRRVTMQIGRRGVVPLWGKTSDRQPVMLEIELGDERAAAATSVLKASRTTKVTVHMRPIGWVRNRRLFDERARRLLKELRSYFVAN